MAQGGLYDPLLGWLAAEGRLGAGRLRPMPGADLARVAVGGKGRELLAGGRTKQAGQRPSWRLGQLTDGGDADRIEPGLGCRSHAPYMLDRQVGKEGEFMAR